MEPLHQNILRVMQSKIVDDMDVENGIINPLKMTGVLNDEDIERILQMSSKRQRAEVLLEILPRRGRKAFYTFRRGLRHHYWWLDEEIEERIICSRDEDAIDAIRNDSEGPILSFQPPTITRERKVRELKAALERLRPGGYLVLHGMKGFGKSSLTAGTLTDEGLLSRHFNNQIYWIKFGNKSLIQDEISIQLNRLYHQLSGSSDNVNSSLSSDPLKQHLINCLQCHFDKSNHRKALLILDDVWNKDIIDAFDFSCKTLVITSDLRILDGKDPEIIKMTDGFTEAESLGLFAKVLDIDVNKLPVEAKRIHEESYGMPMVISMLAAQFKKFDDMDTNKERWLFYLDSLRTKDPSNKVLEKVRVKLEAIFKMCIEKLEPQAKWRYETLAIFSQDVNIMPKTLSILWDEKKLCQVDVHMLDFCEKSLAARHRNDQLNCYTYGVHELLLSYLRDTMTAKQLIALHRSFIEKLREFCQDDFSKLPDDNYSFSYIGHHLEQAKMSEELPKLYLDFNFLREKIYHSGLSDLLIDLNKYRSNISGEQEEGKANVVDLEKFLKSQAGTIVDHKLRKCLDLVQIGLNYSETGFVRKNVLKVASKRSSKLYVTYDKRYGSYEVPASLEVVTDMTAAVFFNNPNKILIGNSSGEVMLWNCETHEHSLFSDNRQNEGKSIIKKIIVSSNGDFFLTLCDSGQVNLFNVRNEELRSNGAVHVQTPREKQDSWIGIHGDNVCKDSSHVSISIENETITDVALSVDDRIGICTDGGTIEVWTIDGQKKFTEKVTKTIDTKPIYENFEWITFTEKKVMLQVMNHEGVIRFYSEKCDELNILGRYSQVLLYRYKFEEQNFVLFQPLPGVDKCLVIVTDTRPYYLTWQELYRKTDMSRVQDVFSPSVRKGVQVNNVKSLFTCAALTDDGKYLVTGHSKSIVTVWRVDGASEAIATFNGLVTSLDTCWLNEGHHLISGSGDRVIHRWSLSLENLPVKIPVFDAVMKPWGEDNIVAKESFQNTIQIYRGDSMLAETEPVVGTVTDLSINPEGNKVVYASRVEANENQTGPPTTEPQWIITVFNIETKEPTAIFSLKARPNILKFLTVDGLPGIICGENDRLRIYYGTVLCPKPIASCIEYGQFVSIHVLHNSYALTLTRNGTAKMWRVNEMAWWASFSEQIPLNGCDSIAYSCMAPDQKSLTILTANGVMIIYDVVKNDSVVPAQIEIGDPLTPHFNQKISCCEYSSDSKYLAVGLDNGDISIFNIFRQRVVGQLDLHCNEVRHLYWSPTSIGSPILLSANRDELAWWNLTSVLKEKPGSSGKRRYRSTPCQGSGTIAIPSTSQFSSEIASALQDLSLQSSNDDSPENGNSGYRDNNSNPQDFWKSKTPSYSNKNTLLSIVPLPPTCKTKLCVSKDFSKLLFVDTHGSVCNLKFLNYV